MSETAPSTEKGECALEQQVGRGARGRRGFAAALVAEALVFAIGAIGTVQAAPEEQKSGLPALKSVWKMDLPAGTQRVAVADVTDDKLPRLLVLNAEGTLAIRKLSAEGSKEEATVALGTGAARFVVGHFTKGKPAQIVVPNAVFYREGESYRKKELPDLTEVTGSVRFTDGTENIFSMSPESPPAGFELDLSAEKPVKPGREVPQPQAEGSDYREIIPFFPPEMFQKEPFPDEVKNGGLVRLFVPRSDKKLYGVFSWQAADGPYVAVVDGGDLFPHPIAEMKPLWKSPKLTGKVLDIALGADPKGGAQPGLLVLTQAGDDGKGRSLEFFALEP
jgi:hypothetical protein